MRIIPRKTKIKMEFFKNVTLSDIIVGMIAAAIALALFTANFRYSLWVGIAWVSIMVSLFFPMDEGVRVYSSIMYLFRFFALPKKFSKNEKKNFKKVKEIIPFESIVQDRFVSYGEYFAQVIELQPIEFFLLNENKQNMVIDAFSNALRRISNDQVANIVKINKAMIMDSFVYNEDKKYDSLMELEYEGEMSHKEIESRAGVFEGRVSAIEFMNRKEKIYKDYFYFVIMDKDKEILESTVDGIITTLANAATPLYSKKLTGKDLAVFLKANYGKEFDERELESITMSQYGEWAMPEEIKFRAGTVLIDQKPYRQFVITDYPMSVLNAWGFRIFMLDRTRVSMKFNPIPRQVAEKSIDKAIVELETKFFYSAKSSRQIEYQTHLNTLKELLISLKNANQQLYEVNTFITCEDTARKEVRAILKQEGFKFSELFGRQVDAFISSGLSMRDNLKESKRGIPTTSLAAVFPFISGALQDEKGFYLGYNEYPVFVDFFKRDRERVNSNMMVIGKSGSGKSYATKTLLTNFSADAIKIFILDPEDEYSVLSKNLKGKMIDVGSSAMGIINPFHIMTTLEADEGGADDSYSIHLQFLEQFFKTVLEGISSDAFETLNSLIVETYKSKGIEKNTELSKLKPEDFPIFDDLYKVCCDKVETEKDEFIRRNYVIIKTYIQKFASGGRNSNLWNGPTTIETKENFITFSFRSLLANRNQIVANGQMLLIFKYLDNEIIKNKDFNERFHLNRKIIVAVDEAHVFINPNFPIALDFMAQMAKRIRKYSGMLIVITQNIKDFVGSPEIQRQSSAVINACQYSLIFSLAPNDISDLVELYRKAGEINEEEQNTIVTAGVGQCFLITGPMSRTQVQITANEHIKKLFE
ncbi:MAG: DUF87 domain-containing protein [Clostridia bacterium]